MTSPSPVTCIQFNERENNILGVACNNGQVSTVQYSTVQYSTIQYSTVQYSTVQYSTVQYREDSDMGLFSH